MSETYGKAQELVRHGRTGELMGRKKLGNNTWAELGEDGEIGVVLHSTPVVVFWPDGTVKLDSGGWRTVTTKARMNEYAPGVRVFSNRGVWQLGIGDASWPFYDGIQYNGDTLEVAVDPSATYAAEQAVKRRAKLRVEVKNWLNRLMVDERAREVLADRLEAQEFSGDCLYCRRVPKDDGSYASLGDELGGHDHLELHLEEDYFVPMLFVNAAIAKYGERVGVNAALLATPVELRRGRELSLRPVIIQYFLDRLAPLSNARSKDEREAAVARGWV